MGGPLIDHPHDAFVEIIFVKGSANHFSERLEAACDVIAVGQVVDCRIDSVLGRASLKLNVLDDVLAACLEQRCLVFLPDLDSHHLPFARKSLLVVHC